MLDPAFALDLLFVLLLLLTLLNAAFSAAVDRFVCISVACQCTNDFTGSAGMAFALLKLVVPEDLRCAVSFILVV